MNVESASRERNNNPHSQNTLHHHMLTLCIVADQRGERGKIFLSLLKTHAKNETLKSLHEQTPMELVEGAELNPWLQTPDFSLSTASFGHHGVITEQ